MGVTIVTQPHEIADGIRRAARKTKLRPIRIEEGCLTGSNVTILLGVSIRRGTVIGAGSVVIKNC